MFFLYRIDLSVFGMSQTELMPFMSVIGAVGLSKMHFLDYVKTTLLKVADLNFGCATFCALPSFGAVTTFFSHTTFSSHKVSVKGSDIDMCTGARRCFI